MLVDFLAGLVVARHYACHANACAACATPRARLDEPPDLGASSRRPRCLQCVPAKALPGSSRMRSSPLWNASSATSSASTASSAHRSRNVGFRVAGEELYVLPSLVSHTVTSSTRRRHGASMRCVSSAPVADRRPVEASGRPRARVARRITDDVGGQRARTLAPSFNAVSASRDPVRLPSASLRPSFAGERNIRAADSVIYPHTTRASSRSGRTVRPPYDPMDRVFPLPWLVRRAVVAVSELCAPPSSVGHGRAPCPRPDVAISSSA